MSQLSLFDTLRSCQFCGVPLTGPALPGHVAGVEHECLACNHANIERLFDELVPGWRGRLRLMRGGDAA